MNVAITVWDNRISPVFDSAETLLIARIRETEIVDRQIRLFQAGMFDRFVQLLSELDVQVLICGALCAGPARILEAQGVNVISFIAGDTEEILDRYVRGNDLAQFAMPGCRWRRCCRSRGQEVRG
ncbi:MAG: hypothetical protein ACD_75C00893G0003 [uncultured bacterium]|nr:MAG: hypothetical protein ACD_75C00893G0003 [uncultured bacterium]